MNRRPVMLLAVVMTTLALPCTGRAAGIERLKPPEQSLSSPRGGSRFFGAGFGGLFWPYLWHEAQWYVNDVLKKTKTLGGTAGTTGITWGSDTAGIFEIKVRARYDSVPFGIDVWTDYVTWTVEVYAHPPSASCVSPPSPVTVSEGDTQAFTAKGTDPQGIADICRVD